MEDLQELLERDVAGRPVWQWVVIVVVGVALGIAVQRRLAPKGDPAVDPTAAADGRNPITGLTYGEHIGGLTLGQDYAAPPAAPAPGPSTETPDRTNRDWLRDAHDELRGRWAPSVIDTALLRFMNGQELTEEQVKVVDAALLALGPPPDGNPPIERAAEGGTGDDVTSPRPKAPQPTAPAPEPEPADRRATLSDLRRLKACADRIGFGYGGRVDAIDAIRIGERIGVSVSAPVTVADVERILRACPSDSGGTARSYVVQSGDTLSGIAARFNVSGGWPALYEANRRTVDAEARRRGATANQRGYADFIWPGTRLTIP